MADWRNEDSTFLLYALTTILIIRVVGSLRLKTKVMALIKCSECGREVSDKASVCPDCGCPIEKKVICQECGQEFLESDTSCPKCGCPNNQRKDSNKTNPQSNSIPTDEKATKIQRFLTKFEMRWRA